MPAGHALRVQPGELAIVRLPATAPLPDWAGPTGAADALQAVVRTADELSVVCGAARVPAGLRAERGWRALTVQGPLDLALTGVLVSLLAPLADAGVPIFAVSTYDTDHVLVRSEHLGDALAALRAAGHTVAT